MAAPERFAEMSDSSCTAGAVHTWHFSDLTRPVGDVRYRGKTEVAARGQSDAIDPFRNPQLLG